MIKSRDHIRETTRNYILSEFLTGEDPASLTDTTPLITGGILDSIGTVRLVTHLEQSFGISLEQRDITVDRFNTVADIVHTVEAKSMGGSKSPSGDA
jgi:acyl carrier protein